MGETGPESESDPGAVGGPAIDPTLEPEVIDLRDAHNTLSWTTMQVRQRLSPAPGPGGAPGGAESGPPAGLPAGWTAPPAPAAPAGPFPAGPVPVPIAPTAPFPAGQLPPGGYPFPVAPVPPGLPVWSAPPAAWQQPPAAWYPQPRRRHRLLWSLAALGVVLLLAGVTSVVVVVARQMGRDASAFTDRPGATEGGTGGSKEQRSAGIGASLQAMTKGVREHDETSFLSAFDRKDAALVARQRTVFAGITALPMEAPQYRWTSGTSEPPAAGSTYPAGALVTAVDFSYRLRGWDSSVVNDAVALVFAPVGGRWLVVGDQAPEHSTMGTRPYAEPWTASRITVVTRPHVLVIGDRSHQSQTDRLATRLEKMVAEVRALWPEPSWNGKVVAYAVTDKRFVAEWFGDQAATGKDDAPEGKASFVAKVTVLPATAPEEAYRPAVPRLIVTPYLLSRTDEYSLSLLRHELTHVATVMVGRDGTAWLSEGVAEYTGFRLGGSRVDALRSFAAHGLPPATLKAMRHSSWKPRLVNDASTFYDSDAATVEAAYTDAWIACLFVADRYGEPTLRKLYDVQAQQPEDAELDAVDVTALQTVLKMDRATFTEAVRKYGLAMIKKVN